MLSKNFLVLCAIGWGLLSADHAIAESVTVELGAAHGTETRDTAIFQNNVHNGAGGAPGFFAGTNSARSTRRGLLAFDVSSIPSNATISDVQLRLVIGENAASGYLDPVIDLHRLLVPWGEVSTGASTAQTLGGTGQGNPAQAGDATWNVRFHDSVNPTAWSQPGGQAGVDYVMSASTSLVQGNDLYDVSLWLSTSALVSDVQGWLEEPATNFGWMLINTNESDGQTLRGFFSHDYNPAAGSPVPGMEVSDFWPMLTVTYEVPSSDGDYDGDGDVDGADFIAWQRGESPDPLSSNDLAAWQASYGSGTFSAVNNVPEPVTLTVSLVMSMGILRLGVRR